MNVHEMIENYQISILDDRAAFTILSLILSKGAMSNQDIKLSLKRINLNFENETLVKLFKSNFIEKNNDNEWIATSFGRAVLSKIGITQSASIQILLKYVKDKNNTSWLENAIKNETDINSTIQVYTKFLVADYLIEKSEIKYIDEEIKSNYFYSLFCSSKNDFYILEKKEFYKKYNYSAKENLEKYNKTLQLFDSCKTYLIEFEYLENQKKSEISKLFASMNFSTRTIVYMIHKILDIGLKSLNENSILDNIDKLKETNKNLYDLSKSCTSHYTSKGDVDDIKKQIRQLLQEELERKNNIQFFLEDKNN